MKTFTIQFDYDGLPRTYIDKSYVTKKDDLTYESIAYNIIESIIENEEYKKEGEIATNIKLFDNEGNVLFNSNNK